MPQRDGLSCPGCGLPNWSGLCPHCRGDQDEYERKLVPPFPTSRPDEESAALLRTPRGEGEEDGGELCDLCGEEFNPSESGTVIGPLGQDDGVPRWYRCPRCARAYDAGYQRGQRDPRGDETADPTALRSDAQGEDRWEDLVFGPITEAYNEAHTALRSGAQEGEEDALVCASCGEPIGDEPTVIWQDAYTHYRCTPEDAIRDDTPVIRPIDAARRGEGGSDGE